MIGNYKLDGKTPVPCEDIIEWAMWYEKADTRVALDTVYGIRVSTIFLGLDHNFSMSGPPVLFETMVFFGESSYSAYQDRYCTYDEAEAGHRMVVDVIQNKPWKYILPWIQFVFYRAKRKVQSGYFRFMDYIRSSE
jgi:hypothetical protein